jgi:hypothetical protein
VLELVKEMRRVEEKTLEETVSHNTALHLQNTDTQQASYSEDQRCTARQM